MRPNWCPFKCFYKRYKKVKKKLNIMYNAISLTSLATSSKTFISSFRILMESLQQCSISLNMKKITSSLLVSFILISMKKYFLAQSFSQYSFLSKRTNKIQIMTNPNICYSDVVYGCKRTHASHAHSAL